MTDVGRGQPTRWLLPVTAMFGYVGSSCFVYSSGVLLEEITGEFGWTRTQFSMALTLQMMLGLFMMPAVGRLVDRVGSRRMALIGIVPFLAGYAMLGLANGPIWQWWLLCMLQGFLSAGIGAPTWLTIVVKSFDKSRGLALAITLSGTGVATAVWPIAAAAYSEHLDWRMVFGALALSWAILVTPLLLLFFRAPASLGATVRDAAPAPSAAKVQKAAILTPALIRILAAGALFSGLSLGMMLHLVPILRGNGLSLTTAASLAGLAGIGTIGGRLAIGFLLDRFSIRPLALAMFLLPVPVALLLAVSGLPPFTAFLAALLLGIAMGGEVDVVLYALSRQVHPDNLGAANGLAMSAFALSASIGPLLASAVYDATGGYQTYLYATVPLLIVAAAIITLALGKSGDRERSPSTKH